MFKQFKNLTSLNIKSISNEDDQDYLIALLVIYRLPIKDLRMKVLRDLGSLEEDYHQVFMQLEQLELDFSVLEGNNIPLTDTLLPYICKDLKLKDLNIEDIGKRGIEFFEMELPSMI
jgi:hypothetical protein